MPGWKPRLVSASRVLVEKLWASATRSFILAFKKRRVTPKFYVHIIDIEVAPLLQETLDCSFLSCYFSPAFTATSEITKTAEKWGTAAESGLLPLTAFKYSYCPRDELINNVAFVKHFPKNLFFNLLKVNMGGKN